MTQRAAFCSDTPPKFAASTACFSHSRTSKAPVDRHQHKRRGSPFTLERFLSFHYTSQSPVLTPSSQEFGSPFGNRSPHGAPLNHDGPPVPRYPLLQITNLARSISGTVPVFENIFFIGLYHVAPIVKYMDFSFSSRTENLGYDSQSNNFFFLAKFKRPTSGSLLQAVRIIFVEQAMQPPSGMNPCIYFDVSMRTVQRHQKR